MNIPGIDMKELNKVIDAYSSCTDIPVTVFDREMNIVAESSADKKFCKFFNIYNEEGVCRKNLSFSSRTSFQLGEPYIFLCPSGLLNIVVALINNREYEGAVVAGPIAMGIITEKNINNAIKLNNTDSSIYLPISLFVREMKIFSPDKINKLALLLYNNITSLYHNIDDYDFMNNKHKIQNSAGRKIQDMKKSSTTSLEMENLRDQLVEKITKGDSYEVRNILNRFLNDILLVDAGSFEIMKVRIFELYLILSMTAIKNGISFERIFNLNFKFINNLNNINDIKELSSCATETVSYFIDNIFSSIYSGQSDIIIQTLEIIENNYMEKLTLQELADCFKVKTSYLSKLFKKELTICFSDYMNKVRIEKAMEMIRNHNMTIAEISKSVGFSDQSYFTKQFKKEVGESPKRYSMKIINDISL